jgi:protein-tyrosine phosphatase
MILSLLAGALVFLAAEIGDWGWLLVWPALSAFVIAAGYVGLGARVLGKRLDGHVAWWAIVLHLPYLGLTWVVWHLYRLVVKQTPCQEVTPGLWLGRRPMPGELPRDVKLIVDLTAEFRRTPAWLVHHQYVCVPTLDTAVPNEQTFRQLVEQVVACEGPVYLHCAQGYGRSATVAAAVLLARGLAADVREAERMLKRVRPGVKLQRAQRKLLKRVFPPVARSNGV